MKLNIADKKIRNIVSLLLMNSILLVNIVPVYGNENTQKEEVIYVNLNNSGDVDDIYVVNSFETKDSENIVDYGKYSSVLNLSTSDALDYSQGVLNTNINSEEDMFYYQGNLENTEIPWIISIEYILNGEKIDANNLAGKSGQLEIKIGIKENENIDEIFFDNYSLQISMMLDSEKCKNIKSEDASIANMGSQKNVSFINLAGSEAEYSIKADVVDFEMDFISFNALNMNMDIDVDVEDMTSSFDELTQGVNDLNKGTKELKQGIDGYESGVNDLDKGISTLDSEISKYQSGVHMLDESTGLLIDGAKSVDDGAKGLNIAVEALNCGAKDLNNGLTTLSQGSSTYKANLDNYVNSLTQSLQALKATLPEEQVNQLQLDSLINGANELSKGYENINGGINQSLQGASLLSSSTNELLNATSYLSEGTTSLYQGIKESSSANEMLTQGIDEIVKGTSGLKEGSNQLVYGIDEINSGATHLNEGTTVLNNSVSDMPNMVEKEIDSMVSQFSNEDFKPKSYVSNENVNIDSVQFAMKTQPIKVEEKEEKQEVSEDKEESMWQLFLNLFK